MDDSPGRQRDLEVFFEVFASSGGIGSQALDSALYCFLSVPRYQNLTFQGAAVIERESSYALRERLGIAGLRSFNELKAVRGLPLPHDAGARPVQNAKRASRRSRIDECILAITHIHDGNFRA